MQGFGPLAGKQWVRRLRLRPLKASDRIQVTTGVRLRPLNRQMIRDKITTRVQGMDTCAFVLEKPRTRAGNEWDWDVGKRARVPESKYKILILEKCMYYVSRVNGRELV